MEAQELRDELLAESTDIAPMDCCHPGQRVVVRGMVRAVTVRPRNRVPALEIELYDGSGSVSVVWLGRRRIPGIDPGRTMVVHGRLTETDGHLTIFNPRYELKPQAG